MTGTSPRANNLGSNESEITGRKNTLSFCKCAKRMEEESGSIHMYTCIVYVYFIINLHSTFIVMSVSIHYLLYSQMTEDCPLSKLLSEDYIIQTPSEKKKEREKGRKRGRNKKRKETDSERCSISISHYSLTSSIFCISLLPSTQTITRPDCAKPFNTDSNFFCKSSSSQHKTLCGTIQNKHLYSVPSLPPSLLSLVPF